MKQLAESLQVDMKCNVMVTSIRKDGVLAIDAAEPGGTAKFIPADLVIVNADLPYATKSLLNSERSHDVFDWDDQFSFSSGVISFHWSVSKPLYDLNTHNVFLVAGSRSQSEKSWEVLRTNKSDMQAPFNFYVHRPTKTDPSAAPDGCDSIMVLVPCRTLLRDDDCAKLPRQEALHRYRDQFPESVIQQVRMSVLARLGAVESLRDLDQHILDEVVDTPGTWAEQFHLAAGTPFALVRTTVAFCFLCSHENMLFLIFSKSLTEPWVFPTELDEAKPVQSRYSQCFVLWSEHKARKWSSVSVDRGQAGVSKSVANSRGKSIMKSSLIDYPSGDGR